MSCSPSSLQTGGEHVREGIYQSPTTSTTPETTTITTTTTTTTTTTRYEPHLVLDGRDRPVVPPVERCGQVSVDVLLQLREARARLARRRLLGQLVERLHPSPCHVLRLVGDLIGGGREIIDRGRGRGEETGNVNLTPEMMQLRKKACQTCTNRHRPAHSPQQKNCALSIHPPFRSSGTT